MLLPVHLAAVARLAAVLLAVTLSGAPRVLALHAPEARHRCTCSSQHGGHHACECARCHEARLRAQAADENAPPCHRAAAREALSKRAPDGTRSAPCLEGTCGGPDAPAVTLAGVEPFCAPSSKAFAIGIRTERRTCAPEPAVERPHEPETPPPRAA